MKDSPSQDPAALRRAAEARLAARTPTALARTETDLRRLQQELEVHQIELELQNEELCASQAELAAELARFSDLYDFAPVGYFNLSADGLIQQVNLTGSTLVGIARARLVGTLFLLLIHPADRPACAAWLERVFAGPDRQSGEFRLDPVAPPLRHMRLEGTRSPDDRKGRVVMVDITALRESKRLAAATIDALATHLCVLDESGQILAVNQAWRDFATANPSTPPVPVNVAEGADYLAVCDAATGPDAATAAAFAAGIRAVLLGKQDKFTQEYPCHSPTEQRWFSGRVTRFPGEGPTRVVVTHETITARKAGEAKTATQLEELRRWYQVTLGREQRVMQLKKQVNQLHQRLGEPPPYASQE